MNTNDRVSVVPTRKAPILLDKHFLFNSHPRFTLGNLVTDGAFIINTEYLKTRGLHFIYNKRRINKCENDYRITCSDDNIVSSWDTMVEKAKGSQCILEVEKFRFLLDGYKPTPGYDYTGPKFSAVTAKNIGIRETKCSCNIVLFNGARWNFMKWALYWDHIRFNFDNNGPAIFLWKANPVGFIMPLTTQYHCSTGELI